MSTAATALKLLTRDEILAAKDREDEIRRRPRVGRQGPRPRPHRHRPRPLSRRASCGSASPNGSPKLEGVNVEGSTVRLVSMSIVDAEDQPLFTPADVIALGQKSSAPLDRVNAVASRLSRLTTAVSEAVADLKADRNGSSGSD
jgi:hypothetical protein